MTGDARVVAIAPDKLLLRPLLEFAGSDSAAAAAESVAEAEASSATQKCSIRALYTITGRNFVCHSRA